MIALYTFVHLVHFPCTVNVIPLYNSTNFISLLPKLCVFHVRVFNHISNGLVEKMVDDLRSIFFPQISLLEKLLEYPCGN